MKLESEKQRREVSKKNKKLRGKKKRIVEDLTWGERKIRWSLEEIARKKERKGNSVERIWEAEYNWAMVEIK